MEDWRKRYKERTIWTRSKSIPFGVDVLARFFFSVNFWASSSSCCYIMMEILPSLMIICSFFSIFCTSSSSIRCSPKASWASLGELIYHLFGTDLLRSIFDRQFWKVVLLVLEKCSKDCIVIGGRSKPYVDRWSYMGVFTVWGDMGLCHCPRRWVDGAQCKCKFWFVF